MSRPRRPKKDKLSLGARDLLFAVFFSILGFSSVSFFVAFIVRQFGLPAFPIAPAVGVLAAAFIGYWQLGFSKHLVGLILILAGLAGVLHLLADSINRKIYLWTLHAHL